MIRLRGDFDPIGRMSACSEKYDWSDVEKPQTHVAWIGTEAALEHENLREIGIKDKLGR